MQKDFYKILGVSKTASQAEIKQAFRALAKKHHPDIDATQAEYFKEISEAYETLSDEKAREKYDGKSDTSYFHRNTYSKGFDAEDFFRRQFYRQEEEDIFNMFRKKTYQSRHNYEEPNTEITIPITMAYNGGAVQVEGIDAVPISIFVRPKTLPNTKINIASKRGNISVTVKIVDDSDFRLVGNHIETTVKVPLKIAILGGEVFVKTPSKDKYIIKIPSGTQSGTIFNLKGLGLGSNDIRAKIDVQIPKCDNNEALENFKKDVNSYTINKN